MFLDLGGDYTGVHSVMIPLALLICVVYFSVNYTSQSKKKNLKKKHELWKIQPGLESWFSHLAVVT